MNYISFINNKKMKITAALITSFASGLVVGTLLPKKLRVNKVKNDDQMSLFDDNGKPLFKVSSTKVIEELIIDEPIEEVVEPTVELPKTIETVRGEKIIRNVFDNSAVVWDQEREFETRSPDAPYVITDEEFFANDFEHAQSMLTYYVGDDILADEADTPIYNYSEMVGELKFGYGTNDPNVFYVRSERLRHEWEIIRHSGKFEEEVLGLMMETAADDSMQHSVLKFRRD